MTREKKTQDIDKAKYSFARLKQIFVSNGNAFVNQKCQCKKVQFSQRPHKNDMLLPMCTGKS